MSFFQWNNIDLNAGKLKVDTIVSVDQDALTATCEKTPGNIPIHYHCSEEDVEDDGSDFDSKYPDEMDEMGASAFSKGDEVLVMFRKTGDKDPIIIGFAKEDKTCGFQFKIIRDDDTIIGDSWYREDDWTHFDDWSFVPYITIKNSLGESKNIYYGDQSWWDTYFPEMGWEVGDGDKILTYDSETQYWSFSVPDELATSDGYWVNVGVTDSIGCQFIPPDGETPSGYSWKPDEMGKEAYLATPGTYNFPVALWRTTRSADPAGTCPDLTGCTSQEPRGGVDISPYNQYLEVESSVPYKVHYEARYGTSASYWGSNNIYDCSYNSCDWCDENACERWAVYTNKSGWATVTGGGEITLDPLYDPLDNTIECEGNGSYSIEAKFTGPDPIGTDRPCCNVAPPCPNATTSQPMALMCWSQFFSISAYVNYDGS